MKDCATQHDTTTKTDTFWKLLNNLQMNIYILMGFHKTEVAFQRINNDALIKFIKQQSNHWCCGASYDICWGKKRPGRFFLLVRSFSFYAQRAFLFKKFWGEKKWRNWPNNNENLVVPLSHWIFRPRQNTTGKCNCRAIRNANACNTGTIKSGKCASLLKSLTTL